MGKSFNVREYHEGIMAQLKAVDGSRAARPHVAAVIDGRHVLFDASEVGEIVQEVSWRTVPRTVPWYRGIKNVRGSLHGVVDLAGFIWGGDGLSDVSPASRLLLASHRFDLRVAFLVDRIVGLRPAETFVASPRPVPAQEFWVRSALRDEDGQDWLMIDVGRIMAEQRFLMVNGARSAELPPVGASEG